MVQRTQIIAELCTIVNILEYNGPLCICISYVLYYIIYFLGDYVIYSCIVYNLLLHSIVYNFKDAAPRAMYVLYAVSHSKKLQHCVKFLIYFIDLFRALRRCGGPFGWNSERTCKIKAS